MNTVNQTFNWKRFVAALRKEVVENSRTLVFSVIGIYAFLTFVMILGNIAMHSPEISSKMMSMRTPQTVVFGLLSLVVCVMASLAFKNLTTKSGRTSYFTSPSSTLEKYLVNILIYVVGTIIAFFACAQLADLTRIAVLKLLESSDFVVPGPINFLGKISNLSFNMGANITDGGEMNALMTATMYVSMISSAAMYLLGSVIWPKLSLLKTYAAGFVAETAFGIIALIAAVVVYMCGDIEAISHWFVNFIKSGNFFIMILTYSAVLGVLFTVLSWYLFKRKDVVSLKWWK